MFQAPRGTRDLLPDDYRVRDRIMSVAREQGAPGRLRLHRAADV